MTPSGCRCRRRNPGTRRSPSGIRRSSRADPQLPSPHTSGHFPQSSAHDAHVSVTPQSLSPQTSEQAPQSLEQDAHVSRPTWHLPSPHQGQGPQSSEQSEQVSVGLAGAVAALARADAAVLGTS